MTEQTTIPTPLAILRDSAGVRSAAYLGSMAGVLLLSMGVPRNASHPFLKNVHPITFPAVLLITDAFTQLRPADRATWTTLPTRRNLTDLARGIALGTAASMSVLGVAALKGWISAPAWGWEQGHTPLQVVTAVGWTSANLALLVFNEEQIFRGYGFDTLRAALGTPGAMVVSVPLFALYHGRGVKRFLGLGTAGLFLTLLRLGTGNLWLAAGFHFAWNLAQEGFFGPVNGPPSLRPLHLHGPVAWIGRPGHPDPGWLQIIATTLMVILAAGWPRRAHSR